MQTACSILGILGEKITQKSIKKAYFKQALIWHPDKKKHQNSLDRFHEIQEAYVFLNLTVGEEDDEEDDDVTNLSRFINITTGINIESQHVKNILEHLKKGCEDVAFKLIENLDKHTSIKIYDFLKQYYFLFGLEYSCVERMEKMLVRDTNIVILTPKLENLFNSDIYNLELETGESYYIPLWHDELEFNTDLSTLIVRIEPILPENVVIDDDNNVHIFKTLCIGELFGKETYSLNISSQEFTIDIHKLVMKQKQIICFERRGIAKVNTKTIFSVSKISDVLVHIDLFIES